MTQLLRLIRPEQWLKNGFVFLPLFFGGQLFNPDAWIEGCITFVAFSFIASAVYCINDLKDVAADRQHPKKCKRPVASGDVSVKAAISICLLLIALSLSTSFLLLDADSNIVVSIILISYLLLNVTYCYKLKYIGIVDVFVIAIGFVLRLASGGVAEQIELSPWIVLMTFLLALFLAFAKRRDDVILNERNGVVIHRGTQGYNLEFMNAALVIIASVTMVCYLIYTVSPDVMARLHSRYAYISSVFVLAGILRYLQIALVKENSGSPTKVLVKDRFIQITLIGWVLFFLIILYL